MVESFEEISLKYDLQKIKTIGDAFMAVAGLLKPLENPVANCIKAGLEMIAATRSLPARWQVRIGIHFGMVMGGIVGHRQYLFDVWGDFVQLKGKGNMEIFRIETCSVFRRMPHTFHTAPGTVSLCDVSENPLS